jgi:hypothetical protein
VNDGPRVFVCRRSGLFSKTYRLSLGSDVLGTIGFRNTARGDIQLEGRAFVPAREAPGAWTLTAGDSVIASARRFQDNPLSIELGFDGRTWLIQASTKALLRYDINERGSVVGRIQAKPGLVSNRLEVHAPEDSETPTLAFAAWLVGIHWIGIVGVAVVATAKN